MVASNEQVAVSTIEVVGRKATASVPEDQAPEMVVPELTNPVQVPEAVKAPDPPAQMLTLFAVGGAGLTVTATALDVTVQPAALPMTTS